MEDTQVLECTQALPDDWNNEDSAPNEQHHVAWLEINGIRHDVYEGETVIGRDATTCKIVLQSKVISIQHAVIEVEGDMHTIADLGSRNKTRMGKMALKPNVRYALQGGENLKFGDLLAKYIIKEESQADDSGSETGSESMLLLNDSEERTVSPVLSHHLPDFIPETPVTANVHSTVSSSNMKSHVPESPSVSQSTPLPKKNGKMSLSYSPGNVSAIQNLGEDSFFFEPSQPPKEKAANVSDTDRFEGLKGEGYNSDESTDIEDDSGPARICNDNPDSKNQDPSKTNKDREIKNQDVSETNKDPSRFEGLKAEGYNSDESTDIEDDSGPAQTCNDKPESKNQDVSETNKDPKENKSQDVSETNKDLSKNKDNTFKGFDGNVPFSKVEFSSKGNDIKITDEDEKGMDSDGSTDIEEDIFNQATQVFSIQDKLPKLSGNVVTASNMSPAQKNFDSTQEIMEAFGDDEDDTMLATQTFVATESPNKKFQELDDEIPTQLFLDNDDDVFKKPIAKAPKNKKRLTGFSSNSRDIDDDIPDDLFDETANADILDTPTQPFLAGDQHQPSNSCNDDLDASTLPFDDSESTYKFQLPCKTVRKEKYGVTSAGDDLFNQPTQLFVSNNDATTFDEDIPTQYFDPTPKNETPKKENKYLEKGESDMEMNIYDQPTQIFSEPKDGNDDDLPPTQIFSEPKDGNDDDLPPTQIFSAPKDGNDDDLPPTQIFSAPKDGNDDGLPLTQIFSAPKDGIDDHKATVQLADVAPAAQVKSKGGREGTSSKVDVTSHIIPSPKHMIRQAEVHNIDDDDDLPLTQIFSAPKDDADGGSNAPTQPYDVESDLHLEDKGIKEGTNKVDVTSRLVVPATHIEGKTKVLSDDDLPPTQIFSAPKDGNDEDYKATVQLPDVAPAAQVKSKGGREGTSSKVDVTSHLITSPKHVKGQAEVHNSDDDDDLPPTQIFSAPKDDADGDINAPTQLFDVELGLHSENRSTKEGTSNVDATSQLVSPAAHINVQNEVDVNDDDLPPTQIFTTHFPSKQAPDPTVMEDIVSSTQPFSRKASQEVKDVLSPNALKVSDDKTDSQASTLVLREMPVSDSEDDYGIPTQPFTDDGNNKKSDASPQQLSNESKMESKKPSSSIIQAWDELDADVTQDISIDCVVGVGIDEVSLCTTTPLAGVEQNDDLEDSALNDSASDTSETLLNERQLGDEGEVILSDFSNDGSHSASPSKNLCSGTDSKEIEPIQDQGEEEGTKALEIEYMDTEKKEKMEKCSIGAAEKENYNSDESTDIEDDLPCSQNNVIPVTKVNTSIIMQGKERSHAELSSGPDILGNKVCILPGKESPQISHKQQKSLVSSTCPLKEAESNKKSFQFKRVSKILPVVASSPDVRASTQSQSTQDSSASTDFSLSVFSFPDSDESKSLEAISDNMQAPEKEGKVLENHRYDSGSDHEDDQVFNISQKLFDLPPDEDVSTGNTSKNEMVHRIEYNSMEDSKMVEKVKVKDTKTAQDLEQKDMVMVEGNAEVQESIVKINVKDVAHKNKRKVPDGEESVEKGNISCSISGSDSSILGTPKRKKGLKSTTDVQSHLTYDNETNSSTTPERRTRSNSVDKSGSKSEESSSFSGFEKSPKRENSDTDSHKDKGNREKSESISEAVQDLEEARTKEEDDLVLKTKEFNESETSCSGLSVRNVDEEQQSDSGLNVTKTSETDKHSVSKGQRKRKGKDKVSVLPARENNKVEESVSLARDKRKKKESLKVVEQNKAKDGIRTKNKDTDSELSSRNSSTSRDSVDGITLEDVPNIRRSGRRRNNSDASTSSNLSHISNQSAAAVVDEESGFSLRSKWKGVEKNMKAEQTAINCRTRTMGSDSEPSSRNSSSSREGVSDVTLDDVQNIRRSSRGRNGSGTSTQSNLSQLSSSSSRSETTSVATALSASMASTIKRGRRSKRSIFGKIDEPPQETVEDDDKISSSSEKSSRESDISANASKNNRSSYPPLTDSGKNKGVTRRSCRKLASAEVIDDKLEIITPKMEISALPEEAEGFTSGRARSSRTHKEPKRFSPDIGFEANAVKRTSGRNRGRNRKSDVSQIKQESFERLPPRRARRSAMPNLFSSASVMNDEEVEIVLAQMKSALDSSSDKDDRGNQKEVADIPKRGRRSTASKAKGLKENKASVTTQEADTRLNETKESGAAQNCRKSRSSTATSQLITQSDPIVPKKPKLSPVPEKKDEESNDTIGAGRRIQKRAQRSQKTTREQVAQESKSIDQSQGFEKKCSMQRQLPTEWSNESTGEETESSQSSSQSSEDSHACRKSKRKRGKGNSLEDLLSTPKSSRSGRSRMGSPSVKDNILWSPTQRQQQASTKPRVLFTGYKDTQDEKIVIDLGGTVVECPQECTVLVTTNIRRTCKLLAVIGKGLPIVSPTWLSVSKQARNFVDPWKFLVKDREAEEKFGFCLEDSLKSASKVLLFEGLSLHTTKSVKPPPDQMKEIIECSGGEYLDMPPRKYAPQVRIVSCLEDKKQWTTYKRLGIPILGTEFILTGLLRHELLLDEFLIG